MIFFHSNTKNTNFDIELQKQWTKFTELLERSKKDGTYDIDFNENIEFSEFYLIQKKELPCFLILDLYTVSLFTKKDIIATINTKNSTHINPDNLIQEYLYQNDNSETIFNQLLKNYKDKNLLKTICPPFSPKTSNYPALVFHSKDIQQCKKIRKYTVFFPQISDHFYFSDKVSGGVFYYYHNENDFIFKKISKSKGLKIIREYCFFPFSNSWGLPDIRQIKDRRVAFIVYSNNRAHPLYDPPPKANQTIRTQNTSQAIDIENEKLRNMVYNISDYFWKDIVFNKITLDDFNLLDVKMNESDTPFIFVSNLKKSKFLIIKNISIPNKERIITKIKQIRRGLNDNEMEYTFFPILSVFYENTRTLKNTLCFTFVALIIVAFTTFTIVKRASFCINPQSEIMYPRKHKF